MATHFQLLGPEDMEVLTAHLVAWHRQEGVRLDQTYTRREARRILSDNHAWHTWLIVASDEVVGYLMLNFRKGRGFEAPRANLAALYVVPAARGRQIGRQAHRFVLDLGRWLHVRIFECDTADEGRHAPPFSVPLAAQTRWMDTFPRQATA